MGIASLVLGILSLVSMFLILIFKISFGAIPSIMAMANPTLLKSSANQKN